MRRTRPAAGVPLVLAAALVAVLAAVALAAKPKTVDLIWTHPDVASLGVRSIAMLPVGSYDNNIAAQSAVARAMGIAVRGTGYRWIAASSVADLARGDAVAESLLKVAREGMLRNGRVDSLVAPALCARFRTNAVLALRIDQWEQRALEYQESGKASTTIQLHAALVDTLGRLVWSAQGSQTGEGPYQEANAQPLGVSGTTLNMTPLTNQGGPPSFEEVLDRILGRWAPTFPRMAAAPAKP